MFLLFCESRVQIRFFYQSLEKKQEIRMVGVWIRVMGLDRVPWRRFGNLSWRNLENDKLWENLRLFRIIKGCY